MNSPAFPKQIDINPDTLVLREDSRYIYQPRFANEERSVVKAIVLFPDGSLREMEGHRDDVDSPLVRDIFLQYSETEIEMHTYRERCMTEKMHAIEAQSREDAVRRQTQDELFRAKTEALQVEAVKSAIDRSLARQIRSARSLIEVQSLVVVAMLAERETRTAACSHHG